eukprot:gene19527-11259_t
MGFFRVVGVDEIAVSHGVHELHTFRLTLRGLHAECRGENDEHRSFPLLQRYCSIMSELEWTLGSLRAHRTYGVSNVRKGEVTCKTARRGAPLDAYQQLQQDQLTVLFDYTPPPPDAPRVRAVAGTPGGNARALPARTARAAAAHGAPTGDFP